MSIVMNKFSDLVLKYNDELKVETNMSLNADGNVVSQDEENQETPNSGTFCFCLNRNKTATKWLMSTHLHVAINKYTFSVS